MSSAAQTIEGRSRPVGTPTDRRRSCGTSRCAAPAFVYLGALVVLPVAAS